MAITLAQAKIGMDNKMDQAVIDEFRRSSFLLDNLIFDDAVSPSGGSTLVYGYERLLTPATAGFRAINSEYTPNEAIRTSITTNLKIFGGSFELDRVIAKTAGAIDETSLQMNQKIKAASNLFHYNVIRGDEGGDPLTFDGLDVTLTGSSTEIGASATIDIGDATAVAANYVAAMMAIDDFLAELDGIPTFLMGNGKLMSKIKAVARMAGYLTQSEGAFGLKVSNYDSIPLIDLGKAYIGGNTVDTVPVLSRTIGGTPTDNLTDLYAVRVGLDGFHGITVTGNKIITQYLPDFASAGAVKKGEVEMIAGLALKNTRAAGVLRNFIIA